MSLLFKKPDKTRMMTEAPWKAVLIFATPLMLSSILQNTYLVTDTLLVGYFNGENALATVGSVSILVALLKCTSWGFSTGINAVLSRYRGANNDEGYQKTYRLSVLLTAAVGLTVALLGLVFGELVMKYVMGIPEDIMDMARSYYYISLFGVFFTFVYNTQGAVLRSIGNTSYLLYALLSSSFLNIVLDILFISVLGWGVAGAAIGSSACALYSIFALSFLRKRGYPELSVGSWKIKIEKHNVKEIMEAALPMAVQQLIIFSTYVICQNPINGFGVSMTAAYGVERNIEIIARIPMTAFGAGMLTFSGMAYGARNRERLFLGVKQIWMMSMGVTLTVGVIVALLSPIVVGFFSLDGTAYNYAVEYVRTVALTLPMFTAYFAIHGFFQGIKRPMACTIITFTELLVRTVALYTLDSVIGYQIVWYSVPISWSFAIVCSAIMFVRYRKKVSIELSQEKVSVSGV